MILASREVGIHLPSSAREFAHLHEYFGIWAMRETTFRDLCGRAASMDLGAHMAHEAEARANADSSGRGIYQVTPEGVAIITIRGPMMKFASSMGGGASTVDTRRKVRSAQDDPFVKAIVLVFDSPGGTVSGTKDLADDVAAAAKQKPVYGYVEDLCCSAAFWVASQCTRIFSNATSLTPCIGTYMVIDDWSKAYEKAGVQTHVIKAGEFKGAGLEGTAITTEQLAEWQGEVNDLNDHFVRAVATGRRVSQTKAREWADGRAFVASKSVEMGILDGVQSLDDTIAMAAKAKPPRAAAATGAEIATHVGGDPITGAAASEAIHDEPSAVSALETASQPNASERSEANSLEKESSMSTSAPAANDAPKAATLEELEAACPGADNDFLMKQLRGKATKEAAQTAWAIEQNNRLEAARKETAAANEAAAKAKEEAKSAPQRPGATRPVGAGIQGAEEEAGGGGTATEVFNRLVKEQMTGGMSKKDAVREVALKHPDAHAAYVVEYNERNSHLAGDAAASDRFKRKSA